MKLTASQKVTLEDLRDGPGLLSAPVAVKMIKRGLIERTGEPGAQGKSHVRLTDAGRAAI
jgi:hypothetical protein